MNTKYLNSRRCTLEHPFDALSGCLSDDSYGFNGMFMLSVGTTPLRIIASDGMGWKHVSVSRVGDRRCPTWEMMCAVKDLFWDDEDVVVQYHPAKSQYVNNHPRCLHLWQPTQAELPVPPSIMVGFK